MLYPILIFLLTLFGVLFGILKKSKRWQILGIVIAIIGAILSLIESYRSNQALIAINDTMDNTNKFSHIALLGSYGGEYQLGNGLATNNKLYNLLAGTYRFENDIFYFNCGEDAEKVYHQVIDEYPDFPFSYYALADCKSQRNEKDWIDYAKKAIKILEITTTIGGHKIEHDNTLNNLKEMMKDVNLKT